MYKENQDFKCCPKFDPAPWDEQIFDWIDKKFIKSAVSTFFFMPLNFGSVMKKLMGITEKAKVQVPDWLCLSDYVSKWKTDLYLAVDKEIIGAENVTLTGAFLAKVYEGSFKDTGLWCADYEKYATGRGYHIKNLYIWYTTCPKCAKKYGKNYVIIIARVEGK